MHCNFCTLFDKNYIYKGLALYESLLRNCQNFKLWILCMDNDVYEVLKKINLKNAELINLDEFEDEELKKAKNTRSHGEYCWTCASSLLLFILNKYPNLETIAYLDADIFFYNDIEPIYEEFGENSIFIIKHCYSREFLHLQKTSGIYNVALVIFRNDDEGKRCLTTWRKQCLDWCFGKKDDGKYGDQMYLNDWTQKFKRVAISQNIGVDIAPWNVKNYRISQKGDEVFTDDVPLIFYHFHRFKIYGLQSFNFAGDYNLYLSKEVKNFIYKPYREALINIIERYKKFIPYSDFGFQKRYFYRETLLPFLIKIKRVIFN